MRWYSRLWTALLKAAPLRLWVLISAGPALTACAAALVYIVWRGGWPIEMAAKQLDFLGWSLLSTIMLIGVIVITLAAVKVRAGGPGGTHLEVDATVDSVPEPPRTTTVQTTVETKA